MWTNPLYEGEDELALVKAGTMYKVNNSDLDYVTVSHCCNNLRKFQAFEQEGEKIYMVFKELFVSFY
jgi:hypothetical protein